MTPSSRMHFPSTKMRLDGSPPQQGLHWLSDGLGGVSLKSPPFKKKGHPDQSHAVVRSALATQFLPSGALRIESFSGSITV